MIFKCNSCGEMLTGDGRILYVDLVCKECKYCGDEKDIRRE